ncbi:sterol 3-beta-glucosyltransferase-like [Tetranychus urticae]|uniref:UDP-glycosyltransferase 201A6 n=1 Tax=Tetranychus urticae TaxID=32264 RepID=T1KRR4_TETUR|nr:sterol 3-beta-glucosyltransferase-like [Tetranychus urticae]AHX56845.1 UDP-glycosyltransferase 201A6 [Tetranychus urticae]
MTSKPRYRFLISSIDAFGHINCILAFGEILALHGHEVTFAHRQHYKKLADSRNFKFISFDETIFENIDSSAIVKWFDGLLHKFSVDAGSIFDNWTPDEINFFGSRVDVYDRGNRALEAILKQNEKNFDMFIGDFVMNYPLFHRATIPCALLLSMNPVALYPNGPPAWSGFSVKGDKKLWDQFRMSFAKASSVMREKIYSWWKSYEVPFPTIQDSRIENWLYAEPEHLGFYHYPDLLDYHEIGPIRSDKWMRIDRVIRRPENNEPFNIPESLKSLPGKLIFFSLGSIGSVQINLMKTFIKILSKSPNRFIISKGPKGDELELAPNMWGENYVNQLAILEAVDLVITHGGNNTFLETIHAGKPLIVVPFFMDQLDNAQRAVDCGIGSRINLCDLDETKLLKTIEETLSNIEFAEKIAKISDSMKSTKSRGNAVKKIESFLEEYQKDAKNKNSDLVQSN